MRNLQKLFFITLICFFSFYAKAQTIGIKGGLSLSNVVAKDDDNTYSNDYKSNVGFHIGATIDYPLSDIVSIEPGLLLNTKGATYDDEIFGVDIHAKTTLLYLDIPILVKAAFDIGGGAKIFGAVGPYIGFGLSGKVKTETKAFGITSNDEEDIKWGNDKDNDDLKRLDAGFNIGAGVQLNAIELGISYDLGLANIAAYTDNGNTINNRVFKISVGYRFGK